MDATFDPNQGEWIPTGRIVFHPRKRLHATNGNPKQGTHKKCTSGKRLLKLWTSPHTVELCVHIYSYLRTYPSTYASIYCCCLLLLYLYYTFLRYRTHARCTVPILTQTRRYKKKPRGVRQYLLLLLPTAVSILQLAALFDVHTYAVRYPH